MPNPAESNPTNHIKPRNLSLSFPAPTVSTVLVCRKLTTIPNLLDPKALRGIATYIFSVGSDLQVLMHCEIIMGRR